ncbi:MAG: regulator [Flavobacteriaceae bacterium]|nr:regulator [Flavobacteriaceae bacterium]|tara:strand:+ start:6733 stop:8151 length:1419 start_codon:yes stop_codon:yes gene_type:complete
MKTLTLLFTFTICFASIAQTPCENGTAGPFECSKVDLLSQVTLATMNSVKANDSWGWTDPMDGKEYALICLNEATAFIDVSDPVNPIYLGQLPGESTEHTTWRDVKTYNNYAFIVSEDDGHGMQVFDLTKLRNVANPPVTFTKDAYYDGFGKAHNIIINEDTGFAYAVGSDTFNEGPHFINIQDPLNPIAAGGHAANGYCHDAQVVIYDGPDADYTGREILFGSNEDEIVIEDVTDKSNVVTISTITYSNFNYTHQGWLTEDQRYFILGDETDEINTGINSRTLVFDFQDLDDPQFKFAYTGPSPATDHNGYIKGNKFYLANNAAGFRMIDISDIANNVMTEIAFFDSYPTNNQAGFNGAWNVYPYFESGNIIISDRSEGMLLVRPLSTLGVNEQKQLVFEIFPNPTHGNITIKSYSGTIDSVTITDVSGKQVYAETAVLDGISKEIDLSALSNGLYIVTVNNTESHKVIKQ